MIEVNYTELFKAVISLVSAIVTIFVIPWIKTKIDNDKLNKIISYVAIAAKAAEQIYNEAKMGKQKKAYVVQWLKENGIKIEEKELDALIESEVFKIRDKLKEKEVA